MYTNIQFPEGTVTKQLVLCPLDLYNDDDPVNFATAGFPCYQSKVIVPQKNFEQVYYYGDFIGDARGRNYIPVYGLGYTNYSAGGGGNIDKENFILVFSGNINKNIDGINKKVTIYYPSEYVESYNRYIFKREACGCIGVPYGDVPVRVRVLKDGAWMAGEILTLANTQMNYLGGGLYESIIHQEPRERYNYLITDGTYKSSISLTSASHTIFFGNNGNNVTTYSGETLSEIITDNPNGWYYDAELGGYRNNVIPDKESTTITITLPVTDINILYGMSSEQNYDYGTILDSSGGTLYSSKNIGGDNISISVSSPDGVFIFKYQKDTSNAQGKDAFWIKSISYSQLPPYPEN